MSGRLVGSTVFKAVEQDTQPTQPQALSDGDSTEYTKNDTKQNEITPSDAELSAVIEAWPTLPAAIRTGILAMVEATTK